MNPKVFQGALKEAEAELHQILIEEAAIEERRAELEKRAAKLTENIGHLAALAEDDTFKANVVALAQQRGLTNAVIIAIRAADRGLTVSQIEEAIKGQGFTRDKYQNILATLHVTLDRLSKKDGPIEQTRDERGKKVYKANPNYSSFKIAMDTVRLRKLLKDSVKPVEMVDKEGKPKKVIK